MNLHKKIYIFYMPQNFDLSAHTHKERKGNKSVGEREGEWGKKKR